MKSVLFFALALAVAAYAQNEVVPEMSEAVSEEAVKAAPFVSSEVHEVSEPTTEFISAEENDEAHAEADSYLAKAGAGACKALADATEKEVIDNVKAQQAIMDKIDKGAKCPQEGQEAVNTMQGKLTAAKNKKKAKDKAYDDAMNADVNFGTRKYNSLTKGQCGTFFNSQAYKNAETKVNNAKKAKDAAAGEVTQASKDLEAAKEAAKIAVRKCQCSTYKAHEKALEASNAKVKQANTKAWTKAAHLKCVLDGKTTNQCTVPALPKVKGVSLATGVDGGACSSWDGQKQCGNAVLSGGQKSNFLPRVYRQNGDAQWNAGCFMKDEIPAQRSHSYRLTAKWRAYGTGRGGHVHAMWGFEHLDGSTPHSYPSIDFANYCHAVNREFYVYEKGSGWAVNACNCGSWAITNTQMAVDGGVGYYMQSSQHGLRHCTNQKRVKAKNVPYVIDESIYGKSCDLTDLKLTMNVNSKWVNP